MTVIIIDFIGQTHNINEIHMCFILHMFIMYIILSLLAMYNDVTSERVLYTVQLSLNLTFARVC